MANLFRAQTNSVDTRAAKKALRKWPTITSTKPSSKDGPRHGVRFGYTRSALPQIARIVREKKLSAELVAQYPRARQSRALCS